jgi:hypothetical protein
MAEEKDKKKFFETGFGKFVLKAGKVVPDVLDVAAKVVQGDISGAVKEVGEKIRGAALRDEEAKKLLQEFQMAEWAFEKEMEELAVRDRESARQREMAYVAAGKFDLEHFIMAMVGLISFGFILFVLVYRTLPPDNRDLFIHAIGIVEGVVISMYSYHFGSSRSSKKKDDTINKMMES